MHRFAIVTKVNSALLVLDQAVFSQLWTFRIGVVSRASRQPEYASLVPKETPNMEPCRKTCPNMSSGNNNLLSLSLTDRGHIQRPLQQRLWRQTRKFRERRGRTGERLLFNLNAAWSQGVCIVLSCGSVSLFPPPSPLLPCMLPAALGGKCVVASLQSCRSVKT